MLNFWKKPEPVVNVSYVIGKVTRLTDDERTTLAMAIDFRKVVEKWCDYEIAKNTDPLLDMSITENQFRQNQGYIAWLLSVRNFMKNMK